MNIENKEKLEEEVGREVCRLFYIEESLQEIRHDSKAYKKSEAERNNSSTIRRMSIIITIITPVISDQSESEVEKVCGRSKGCVGCLLGFFRVIRGEEIVDKGADECRKLKRPRIEEGGV
ncbi:hypothetical protein L1887_15683 [Cichorium endivia]|nr:hypothetical protein L1887_15683 [Cichorium endivia]